MRKWAWAAVAAAMGALAGAASAQPAAPPKSQAAPVVAIGPDLVRWDPSIRTGRLPNGLRYAVRSNAAPKGAISLRLGVDVGSYDEADDERGVAHFVEHMGFSGTRNFPERQLDATFAPLGVEVGRDQNAFTEFRKTSYQLDLPTTEAGKVQAAARWLRDVADGMLFADDAVVRERGVIQAERTARAGPFDDFREKADAFNNATLRVGARAPIGTAQSIATMTPARLKAFYDHWYRPENAAVVIVGDLPLDALEDLVKSAFGDWTARGPAGVRAPRTPPSGARGLETLVQANTRLPSVEVICRITAPDPIDEPPEARTRRRMERSLWISILQRRLNAAKARGDAAAIQLSLSQEARLDSLKTCVAVVPEKGQDLRALSAANAELKRYADEGPSGDETDEGLEGVRTYLRGAINGAAHTSRDLAGDMLEHVLDGVPMIAPQENLMAFDVLLAGISPQEVKAAFARDWSGWGPLVLASSPDPITDAAVRTALNETRPPAPTAAPTSPGQAVAAAKPAEAKSKAWGYETFGPAGKVAQRTVMTSPDFVRIRFANGVLLNYRRNAYDGASVSIRVRFGDGRKEIAPDDLMLTQMGAQLLKLGGLGRNAYDEIAERLRLYSWDVKMLVGDETFMIAGDTTATGLDIELNLLAAYFSDPGFRPSLDGLITTSVDTLYRSYDSLPALVLAKTMADTLTPGQPNNLPSRDRLMAMHAADMARVLRPVLTTAPLEVTIVGDIDEQTAVAAVASSLGALPARTAPRPKPAAWFMRFPVNPPHLTRAEHRGNREAAMLGVYWPLYVATPARRGEEYALLLLSGVLRDQLRHRIREDLGMTYTPDARTYMPDNADQGYMIAAVETRPGDADTVLKEVEAMAGRLARGEITQAQLDAVRAPVLSELAAREVTNDWWAGVLSASTRDGQGMRDLLGRRAKLSAITLEDLKRAAADWLSRPAIMIMAVPAAQGASQ